MKERFFVKIFYGFALAYEFGDALVHFPDVFFKRFQKIRVASGDGLILELGCGTGRSTRMFSGKNVTVINLDINKAFVAYGKKKERLVNPLVGSAYDLCFGPDTFDKVIIPDAFHHILYHEKLFAECARVLKPGGELIIFDIVLDKNGPNRVVNHFTDGPIWMLDLEHFRNRVAALGAENNFTLKDFSAVKEKTVMGLLLGGVDAQAILKKTTP